MGTWNEWTPAESAAAIAGFDAGLSYQAIAATLPSRSANAVGAQLRRLGHVLTPEQVLQRRQAGWEAANAAGRIGGGHHRKGKPGKKHTPETIAKMSAIQKALHQCPERRAKSVAAIRKATETRDSVAVGAKISSKKLAWCPPHLRDAYRAISHCNGQSRIPAAEARRMILDDWARQLRRALRQIAEVAPLALAEQRRQHNSFEARLERVKAGTAHVVPTFNPGRVLSEHRSLIGGSMTDLAA